MNESFLAAQFLGASRVDVIGQRATNPPPDHVRLRVAQCGVCASNVPPWEGREWFTYPMEAGAPGHEACGVIEAIGDEVDGWRAGDRVAYIGHRGFAEVESVPATNLLRIPAEVGGDFLAEPLACAMNIFRRAGIRAGDVVAIVGPGFLGTLLIPLAISAGAKVFVITRREREIDARATLILDEDPARILSRIEAVTGQQLCDVVIEATGKQQPLDLAAQLTRVRGRLVIAGYHQDPRRVDMQLWNWRGLDVINAHERDPAIYLEGMRLALDALREGPWRDVQLVSHRFTLPQLGEALRCTAVRPEGFLKAVIDL